MAEPSELIAGLPPWVQLLGGIFTSIGVGVWGVQQFLSKKAETRAAAETAVALPVEHFDPDELLEAGPVVRFLENVGTIADNAKLQTEALKIISAAATAAAKLVEDDFEERRVLREVNRRWDEMERLRRREGGQPSGGWAGP